MSTVVLCNPKSGRVRKQLGKIRALMAKAARTAGLIYFEASDQAQFRLFFQRHSLGENDLLVVVAGDGTFHALLTLLFANGDADTDARGASAPLIYLIAGGTTNMTAASLGIRKRPYQALRALLPRLPPGDDADAAVAPQQCLRVENGRQVLCGMFLGGGLIAEGVNYYRQSIRRAGITGQALPGLVAAGFLLSCLSGRRRAKGYDLLITADGQMRFQGRAMLVLVSVLPRLLLGCRPYWGSGKGTLRLSAVAARPPALLRSLACVLRGRGQRLDADSYISCSADALALGFSGDFILDGEPYCASSGLQLSTAEFRLLRHD